MSGHISRLETAKNSATNLGHFGRVAWVQNTAKLAVSFTLMWLAYEHASLNENGTCSQHLHEHITDHPLEFFITLGAGIICSLGISLGVSAVNAAYYMHELAEDDATDETDIEAQAITTQPKPLSCFSTLYKGMAYTELFIGHTAAALLFSFNKSRKDQFILCGLAMLFAAAQCVTTGYTEIAAYTREQKIARDHKLPDAKPFSPCAKKGLTFVGATVNILNSLAITYATYGGAKKFMGDSHVLGLAFATIAFLAETPLNLGYNLQKFLEETHIIELSESHGNISLTRSILGHKNVRRALILMGTVTYALAGADALSKIGGGTVPVCMLNAIANIEVNPNTLEITLRVAAGIGAALGGFYGFHKSKREITGKTFESYDSHKGFFARLMDFTPGMSTSLLSSSDETNGNTYS